MELSYNDELPQFQNKDLPLIQKIVKYEYPRYT